MEKATNAELKSIITEQQDKYNSLTKLLEKQLEAHNLQQQQQTDAFKKNSGNHPKTARNNKSAVK